MKLKNKPFGNIYKEKRVELRPGLERVTVTYNDKTMLCYFYIKKGAALELHQHEAIQSGIIIKGKVCFTKDDGDHLLEAGDAYLFDSMEAHSLSVLEDTEFIECFTPAREEYKVE
ncbi:MAG: cupin domain-containing protein [Treponema sp.]|jgi:quercetin dioxygenase-like cupin family protein|nr:cupin domain-containing protein [Treponema sp.]